MRELHDEWLVGAWNKIQERRGEIWSSLQDRPCRQLLRLSGLRLLLWLLGFRFGTTLSLRENYRNIIYNLLIQFKVEIQCNAVQSRVCIVYSVVARRGRKIGIFDEKYLAEIMYFTKVLPVAACQISSSSSPTDCGAVCCQNQVSKWLILYLTIYLNPIFCSGLKYK